MGKFQQIASVFMGLFVYNAALIGVFKNRWKVMFGKWSIIMPEFLLRVPRWSRACASDLGLSIVGINYNPIITSIVWTVSSEGLLQLCSQPFLSMFNPLAVKRSMVGSVRSVVWFIKNIFSMLVWDKSIRGAQREAFGVPECLKYKQRPAWVMFCLAWYGSLGFK